ncbi:MAG: vWA domain-containing protein [Acidimicrobiales bacterium]
MPEAPAGAAAAPGAPYVGLLADFAQALRRAGLAVGSGDVLTFAQAMAPLNPTDLVDLYFAGRTTLVHRHDDLTAYDQCFRWFFLSGRAQTPDDLVFTSRSEAEVAAGMVEPASEEPGKEREEEERQAMGLMASNLDILKHKGFPSCTPDELAALRRIMRQFRLAPPMRRSRRLVRSDDGRRPDMRRTVRETMRTHGEPSRMYYRRRRTRPRPLILILDISGSMADYSRCLLQFAYSAQRAATRVEVFAFATRLTRLTRHLNHRTPDVALENAAREVVDWDGGTRIGESLDRFVKLWGRRGLCRGGVVVICSDGLDRGDPAVLSDAMDRLSRLCFRVVWMNPHKGDNQHFRASTLGMMVAEPYIDVVLSGHDLASLEELAKLLPTLA